MALSANLSFKCTSEWLHGCLEFVQFEEKRSKQGRWRALFLGAAAGGMWLGKKLRDTKIIGELNDSSRRHNLEKF